MIYFFFNTQKIINSSKEFVEKYSFKYGYILKNIEISKFNYLDKDEILNYFKLFKNKSIFLIPIKKISKDIKKNKWINNIQIK